MCFGRGSRHLLSVMLTFFTAASVLAQAAGPLRTSAGDCGTVLGPDDIAQVLENARAGLYDGADLAAVEFWYIPISMHVVRRSNGSGGIAESRLLTALNDLNAAFSPAGMVFYRAHPTRYIDSDSFYFDIDTMEEIDALRQTDVVAGTVNLYFTQNLAVDGSGLCGISSFTFSAVQGIVLANGCTGLSDNHSTVPHEVGHYFDLLHTHETGFGAECVNGSNCGTAGDLVCDTPADPGLSNRVDGDCDYTGSDLDPCENAPYSPQTWNLMSYSTKECRNSFTGEQCSRALATNVNLRPELMRIAAPSNQSTFVDGGFPDGGTGTAFFPYDTVGEGVQAAASGGCLIIGSDTYPPALTINKRLTLLASRGPVRLGG
ncbi:MAG: hypothetical protein CHACPFDD_02980 [Phycisphaerae bacterium]|nr:hypothetical protein [Phycisphaerae bacterium]